MHVPWLAERGSSRAPDGKKVCAPHGPLPGSGSYTSRTATALLAGLRDQRLEPFRQVGVDCCGLQSPGAGWVWVLRLAGTWSSFTAARLLLTVPARSAEASSWYACVCLWDSCRPRNPSREVLCKSAVSP